MDSESQKKNIFAPQKIKYESSMLVTFFYEKTITQSI